jgi:succinoglycan biosynthesis protein ExoA
MNRPDYDVVIATAQVEPPPRVLTSLLNLPANERPRHVFLAVGSLPSEQRNQGTALCRSTLVYFLDDDSSPIQGTPTLLASHFEEARTAVSGGPNLAPPDAQPFEKTLSAVLASWMGSFSVRYRYAAIGSVKEATEKELILCNLMVRRATFLKAGGFRTDLYPNEENEFLNRLRHHGHSLMYDPQAAIYRPRRPNLKAFLWQCFRYGRGRAQQMRVYPCLSDLIHLAPAFFVLYLLGLMAIALSNRTTPGTCCALTQSIWVWVPLVIFTALSLWTGVATVSWHRRWADLFKVPALIFLRHILYGLGLFAGLVTPLHNTENRPVTLYEAVQTSKGWTLRRKKPTTSKEKA